MSCYKVRESPPTPPSNNKSPFISILPLFFEEDPLSRPKHNIAAIPSLEPKVGLSPPSPPSDSKDVPLDGWSLKGYFDANSTNPALLYIFDPIKHDDTHLYVSIHGQ